MSTLAVLGGTPVKAGVWRTWPVVLPSLQEALQRVLQSRRWSPTGVYTGTRSFDVIFSKQFARFVGVNHCITTVNGTAALKIALEAMNVGWGDEVILPGITWIADVDAVLSVGAVPVLADVDLGTMCIQGRDVEAAIGPRTRAVIAVHLNGNVADIEALKDISKRRDLLLLEDAAQAHGARFHGRRVGSFGACGAFSMHNSKLLTSGEGGAVLTDSVEYASRAQQLRANGRQPSPTPVRIGSMEFIQFEELTGTNACLSEFQAAVLLAQLAQLDRTNTDCTTNGRKLEGALREFGLTAQVVAEGADRTYSALALRLPPYITEVTSVAAFSQAVEAECGAAIKRLYVPLDRSPLLKPWTRPAWRWFAQNEQLQQGIKRPLHNANDLYSNSILIPHPFLRGSEADTQAIIDSFEKVISHVHELPLSSARSQTGVDG